MTKTLANRLCVDVISASNYLNTCASSSFDWLACPQVYRSFIWHGNDSSSSISKQQGDCLYEFRLFLVHWQYFTMVIIYVLWNFSTLDKLSTVKLVRKTLEPLLRTYFICRYT